MNSLNKQCYILSHLGDSPKPRRFKYGFLQNKQLEHTGEEKMPNRLIEIFEDNELMNKIETRLPYLFKLLNWRVPGLEKLGWK